MEGGGVRGEYGVYQVTGRRKYRGHDPGTTFEAALDPAVEQRALARRDIRLLRRVVPALEPGSYTLPAGWPPDGAAQPLTEAPQGASSM